MREELQKRENQRVKYRATFGGFGKKETRFGPEKTVLLTNLYAGNRLVTDHVWADLEPDLELIALKLIKGKTVLEFYAVAKPYLKDALFRETGLSHLQEMDYYLVEIRQVQLIEL